MLILYDNKLCLLYAGGVKVKDKKAICISASNMIASQDKSTSIRICQIISKLLAKKRISCKVLDLREYILSPCMGCGGCHEKKRCIHDTDFNRIYEEMVKADYIFFVSPHYAPIPAKLCALLEKMEQITFIHWWRDHTYQSELCGTLAGLISHGGGDERALKSYKEMVNDTISNALDTVQMRTVPFSSEWNTGISLPVERVLDKKGVFPVQEYDWRKIEEEIRKYVEIIVQTSKSLYAIC